MTNQKLNIPKTIHVGYQNRSDTYTKKLAYVIYTDEKKKKRKETSWNSWRDNKIDPNDFDNEPTSGFVLNKGVGGARGSWSSNTRNEYIRVYDPRGFEFEISVANLLFILTECNAFKGKGIEGEFVYAWGGTELVLLPVGCSEYKESSEFTSLQSKKITKKDMKEGLTYQHKNTNQMVYVGRHKIRNLDKYWYGGKSRFELLTEDPSEPRHVFWDLKEEKWHFERGFTKLAAVMSSHPDFADLHTKFTDSEYVSKAATIVLSPISVADVVQTPGHWFYIKVDDGYQLVYLSDRRDTYYHRGRQTDIPAGQTEQDFWPAIPHIMAEVTKENVYHDNDYNNRYYFDPIHSVSQSYIKDKELFTAEIQLESETKLEIYSYVKRRTNQEVPCSS